jgi:hypothetical protein
LIWQEVRELFPHYLGGWDYLMRIRRELLRQEAKP